MSLLKIPVRSFPRRKLRNFLTAIAVALSVSLLVGVNLATDSASHAFREYLDKAWGGTDLIVTYGAPCSFGEDNLTLLENLEEVKDVAKRLEVAAFVNGDPAEIIEARGVDPSTDYVYRGYEDTIRGEWRIAGENVVITEALSENYGLEIGDTFTVTTRKSSLEGGRPCTLRVVGIYELAEKVEFNRLYFFVDLDYLQHVSDLENRITSIHLKVGDFEKTAEIKETLRELFGSEFEVYAPKLEAVEVMKSQTESFRRGLDAMVMVSLVVCIFLVFNTMFMSVRERTNEIGILRSVGSSNFQVFTVFFTESLLLGGVGILMGIFAGLILAKVFVHVFMGVGGFPEIASLVLTPEIIGKGVLAGLLAVLGGASYPAMAACRVTVDQALRPEMRGTREGSRVPYFLAGVLLFVSGSSLHLGLLPFRLPGVDSFALLIGAIVVTALLLGKGSDSLSRKLSGLSRSLGMLVSRNLGRKTLRTAVCFGIIGMSLSFIVMLGGLKAGIVEAMEGGIEESLGADIILISEKNLPIGFTENLLAVGGVEEATPVSIVYPGTKCLEPESRSLGIFVVDPESFPAIIRQDFVEPEGVSPEEVYQRLALDNEALVIPKHLAEELGVHAGDSLVLESWVEVGGQRIPDNTTFTVVGVFTGAILQHVWIGLHPLSESAVISFESQAEHFYPMWGRDRAWAFLLNVSQGYSPLAVLERVSQEFPEYGFQSNSLTYEDMVEFGRESIDRVFYILFAVLYFSVFIGAIAVAIVMVMNVTERRREVGILRSQGMSRGQVLLMFLGEAIAMGLIGLVISIACGTIILKGTTMAMAFDGLRVRMILPLDAILHASILALVAALFGGLYPAYRASKLTVVESLRR